MESPYFTLRKATACVCASARNPQNRLEVADLNRDGSGRPIILKAELEADRFLTPSLSAQATQLGTS